MGISELSCTSRLRDIYLIFFSFGISAKGPLMRGCQNASKINNENKKERRSERAKKDKILSIVEAESRRWCGKTQS